MRTLILCLAAVVGLAACSTSSGVVPIGDGIYLLSKQETMAWSGGKMKADLYGEGAAHCKKQGKEISPVADTSSDATLSSYASAEIKFRCR